MDDKDKDIFKNDDQIKVYFSYFSHVMTFSGGIRKNLNELKVSFPDVIYKNLSRKYERVKPPEGSKIEFNVKGEKFELKFSENRRI